MPSYLSQLLLIIVLVGSSFLLAENPSKSDLVFTQQGQLPIILSAPHGGTKTVPDVAPRKGEGLVKGASGFFAGRDAGTEELAQAIAEAVEKKLGKKPYLVIARFHRKYIDANRPADIGIEDARAKPVYDAYHNALLSYCKEVKKVHGRGLLLDVHGQGSARDTIFRGTQNGKTVTLLQQRFGEKAHIGSNSFFGLLVANGCKVFPEVDSKSEEQAGFTGGFIVRHYGSHTAYGIDAIQLEFGGEYRDKDNTRGTAKMVTAAIESYKKLYLSD